MLTTTIEISTIKPIRTQEDLDAAQAKLDYFIKVKAYEKPEGNPLRDEFDIISDLIYAYEQQHDPIDTNKIDPVEYVKTYMEDTGINQNELAQKLDMSVARLSEFLNRKTKMNFNLAVKLYKIVGVPAEGLLEYSADDIINSVQ